MGAEAAGAGAGCDVTGAAGWVWALGAGSFFDGPAANAATGTTLSAARHMKKEPRLFIKSCLTQPVWSREWFAQFL